MVLEDSTLESLLTPSVNALLGLQIMKPHDPLPKILLIQHFSKNTKSMPPPNSFLKSNFDVIAFSITM
jgi:hypothetical protein